MKGGRSGKRDEGRKRGCDLTAIFHTFRRLKKKFCHQVTHGFLEFLPLDLYTDIKVWHISFKVSSENRMKYLFSTYLSCVPENNFTTFQLILISHNFDVLIRLCG